MDAHTSDNEQRTSPVLTPSRMIAPAKSKSRSLLTDLAGWSSYTDMRTQTPGGENSGKLPQPGNLTSETPSGMTHALGASQMSSHLPTPQSPGNMAFHHLTRTPTSMQNLQPDLESTVLPTEFRSHASSSSPPFRPHWIPTPEPSPLVARSRSNGPHLLSQIARTNSNDDDGFPTPSKRDGLRSRPSTPPHTPSRQVSSRPVTPVFQSRPTTPMQRKPIEQPFPPSSHLDNVHSNNKTIDPPSQGIKEEPGGDAARIRAQLVENHLASAEAAESRRPDYFKRTKRLAPSTSAGGGGTSPTSDLAGKDGSLLWSSASVGIIDSPVKGKRIALFQETSEESFEESLMAGGYGRYRSDRPLLKLDEDTEAPNRLGDAIEEDGPGSGLVLTEGEKRKKARLAAFLDPPQGSSSNQLLPVEIEGCGRVLMKVEPLGPQTPPKPTPKAKRSRKRKKVSADMKQVVDKGGITAPEDGSCDGPNWPDTEFPWRSRSMIQDGLSSAEQEERLRYIESFLDRDSDEDDVEEGHSSSSRRNPDEASRSPRPGRGKMYPLLSHSKDRRFGSTMLSVIPSDPADARTALLSKKSIRAAQLRLLRRRNTDRAADSDDNEPLCVCQGRDDGRPLVQCDACQTWYHLECIGIQSTSELGREEDPWFCANCVEVKTPPPVVVPVSEPTFVPTDDGEHGIGRRGSASLEGYDPLFLSTGFNASSSTPWTRPPRPPMTPPLTQHTPHTSSGSSWDEPPSSSSRGDPRTPQFNTASAFGDMVRVYGMTPGRPLEPSSLADVDEPPFDPTSTPSRGIRFGLPFTTPNDGRLGWQGVRGSAHELFHTPKRPGEESGTASSRYGQPLLYHGKGREVSEEGPSGVQGSCRTTGHANVTPVERGVLDGPRRMQVLESPLGAKRSRRTANS